MTLVEHFALTGTRMTEWWPRWRRTCCGTPWWSSRSLSFSLLWFSVAAKGRKGRGWRDDKMIKQRSSLEVTKAVMSWDQLQKDKKKKKDKKEKTGRGETFLGSSKLPTGDNHSNSRALAHHEVSIRLLKINIKITCTTWSHYNLPGRDAVRAGWLESYSDLLTDWVNPDQVKLLIERIGLNWVDIDTLFGQT